MTKNKVVKFLIVLANIAGIVFIIDFIGFMFWAMSGQIPVDGFFVGTITQHLLSAILSLH